MNSSNPNENKKSRNIVFTANTSWYLYKFRSTQILKLKALGYEVTVYAPDNQYASFFDHHQINSKVFKLNNESINFWNLIEDLYSFIRNFPSHSLLIYSSTPKVNLMSGIYSALFRKIYVPNISGQGFTKKLPKIKRYFYKLCIQTCYRNASLIFYQNKDDFHEIHKNYLKNINYKILPGSGVDLKKYNIKPTKVSHVKKFTMISRLIEEKGVRLFCEAAKLLCDDDKIKFYLAGITVSGIKSIPIEYIKDIESKTNMFFLGELEDSVAAIHDSDVIILPSYYPEGTPRILLEAAACGKPIITTNTPGCRDTVTSESGILIEPNSLQELCDAIRNLSRRPSSELKTMGKKGRFLMEQKYNLDTIDNTYVDFTRDTIDNLKITGSD